jgi:large subunit ribosomal protein L30
MQAVIQLRGEVNMAQDVRDTLGMLNIHRVNHCALVPETDTYRGMLAKVHDYVARGEPSVETLATVLARRTDALEGDATVDAAYLSEHTEYDSFAALAAALLAEETTLRDQGLSPAVRLHPPRGGHDGQKHPPQAGGQVGLHTTDQIDALLEAMR